MMPLATNVVVCQSKNSCGSDCTNSRRPPKAKPVVTSELEQLRTYTMFKGNLPFTNANAVMLVHGRIRFCFLADPTVHDEPPVRGDSLQMLFLDDVSKTARILCQEKAVIHIETGRPLNDFWDETKKPTKMSFIRVGHPAFQCCSQSWALVEVAPFVVTAS